MVPLQLDPEAIRTLAALRDAGAAEVQFHSDGQIARVLFVQAPATAAHSPAATTEAEPKNMALEARRAHYENLLCHVVTDEELKRLP